MNNRAGSVVAFIYHGSSGVAGGYTAKFVDGLASHARVHVFVNCGYVYRHDNLNIIIHRMFFPITDAYLARKTIFRHAVRFVELLIGYAIVAVGIVAVRANCVIYSPIMNLAVTRLFARLAKQLSGRLAVVVHDSQSHYGVVERNRDSVYLDADVLVLHNEHSRDALKQRLPVTGVALLVPFPWSLSKLPVNLSTALPNVLFIGHVRPSKGISFLLDAYPKYKNSGGSLGLAVAGSMDSTMRKQIIDVASRVIDTSLGDQAFLDEIANARFVIMPYRPGYSNSSVHYCAVIHCGTPFICSDIELFSGFEHGVDCIKFKYNDTDSFGLALRMAEGLSDFDRKAMAFNALEKLKASMHNFDTSIGAVLAVQEGDNVT